MGDNNSSSDSDNALIPEVNNTLRIASCNAATQTPELPRHIMATATKSTASTTTTATTTEAITDANQSSVVVLRMGNDKALLDFQREAKALAIPDVVVEYIKDTCTMKEEKDGFNSQEVLIRVPSRSSFREDSRSDASSLNLQLPGMSDRSVGSEDELLPIGSQNPRLYYSMPRKMANKQAQQEPGLHSQPSSPKLQRLSVTNQLQASASLLSLLQQNGGNFVVPPSPNFGYRPLESETSAVYTIIKTCVDTKALKEIHFLPALVDSAQTTTRGKRKFEYTPPPPNVERIRRRLQLCTDTFSILFLIPAILLALITPVLIIPMFMYPMDYFLEYVGYFVASGILSVSILALSGLIGNTVWHYNEKTQKLRPKIHCGTGPLLHFWSGSCFYARDDARAGKGKEIIV